MISYQDRDMLADIKNMLRERGEYFAIARYDDDPDQMHQDAETIRRLGRKAGRELKWKITTHAQYGTGGVWVWVFLKESNPVHQAMLKRIGEEQLIAALKDISNRVLPSSSS